MRAGADILVSALGSSPAVVTEAIDLLAEQGCRIDAVHLLLTDDPDVTESFHLLSEHLPGHDNIDGVHQHPIRAHGDIESDQALLEFMEVACQVLKSLRQAGHRLYVSVAGGRKSMAASLALAVQFYGAKRLFHVWVPPWLEEGGHIDRLRPMRARPDELTLVLHPTLTLEPSDRPRLVDLPFIGLFPLLPDLLEGLRGKTTSREVASLLRDNGLTDAEGAPTSLGRTVSRILQDVETWPPARQAPYELHITHDHGEKRLTEYAKRLGDRLFFITKIESIPWKKGSVGTVVLDGAGFIRVYLPDLVSGTLVGLRLTTTASTDGQRQVAVRAVQRYVCPS